ncbi:hypothetical protein ACOSQ4_008977 [Xanthoceras sorbifolium]
MLEDGAAVSAVLGAGEGEEEIGELMSLEVVKQSLLSVRSVSMGSSESDGEAAASGRSATEERRNEGTRAGEEVVARLPRHAVFHLMVLLATLSEQHIQVDKYKVREAKLWGNYQQGLHVDVEKTELELYLLDNCEPANTKIDLLSWWKNSCTKYPILSCIAKDLFVASESAFSTNGRIRDPFRSSLTHKLVEGLVCSQNWLQATYPISEPETLVLEVHAQKEDNCV